MTRHGTHSGYANGCRCTPCRRGHRNYARARKGTVVSPERDQQLDAPWLLQHFPVALIARQAWPDDKAAIAAAFKLSSAEPLGSREPANPINGTAAGIRGSAEAHVVGFAAAADPGSAARPVPLSAGDRAGRAISGGVG